ncbi:MAG: hypothetical protein ACREU2_04570 [Steroidobacteraceae bacterium]
MFAPIAGALLAGCTKAPPSSTAATMAASHKPPMAQSRSEEFHYKDPCSLLQTAEVEAALGAPLGAPPYRGSNIDPVADGTDCVYQTATFQTVTLSVTYEGGQQEYHIGDFVGGMLKGAGVLSHKAKQVMVSEDGSQIGGEWDEAKLSPLSCCIFDALRADQLIRIDFTGSAMTLKAAAALVDAAFKRIDKPLALDGAANVPAAKAFLKGRPRPMDPCSVLSAAEVEAIVGTLATAPKAQDETCSYELPQQPEHPPRVFDLQFAWHDGNYDFRQDLQVAKAAGAALGGMQMQVTTEQQVPNAPAADGTSAGSAAGAAGAAGTHTVTTIQTLSVDEMAKQVSGRTFTQGAHLTGAENKAPDSGPWERSASVGRSFEAVKKDVLVKANTFGVDADKAKALVSAAMAKF